MARKRFLVADLFCGAGGFSTGCRNALADLGIDMELVCVNHWGVAIDTHKANHPLARHYCEDIASVRPHIVVPEGRLDLLTASPSCTHHSVARGGKPTSDQQRSDPWHIVTWLTELDVTRVMVENVWEFTGWGPVDPKTMRPIPSRKGEYFRAWIDTVRRLGYDPEWRKLNAADYGEATTRQRFVLMMRKDRKTLVWPAITHFKPVPGKLDLFPGLKPWRPAREIIDWSIPGKSILDRPIPLAPKTMARILAGAIKFKWPAPFIDVILRAVELSLLYHLRRAFAARHSAGKKSGQRRALVRDYAARLRHFRLAPMEFAKGGRSAAPMLVTLRRNANGGSIEGPIPTVAAGGLHLGLAQPVIINGRKGNKAAGVDEAPVPTLDTKGGVWIAEPIILSPNNSGAPRSSNEPVPTITTGGAAAEKRQGCARPMIVEPFILNRHGDNGGTRAHSVDEPAPTPDCRGAGFVVEPFVATVAHGNDASERDPNSRRANSIESPIGTIHGDGVAYAMVEPFMLSRHSEGAPRETIDPMPTNTTVHSPVLVTAYYGANESCKPVSDPLDTIPTKDRFGMVVPVTNSRGGAEPRDIATQQLPTMTTAKGGEFALVTPLTHADGFDRAMDPNTDGLPTVTGANRGELAFITAQFGEREGQAPRVHDVNGPAPAITATGHVNLVEGVEVPATREYDVLFRMFEPHELAAAMGFEEYIFSGTKTEQVKQIGNAVSVRQMTACALAICGDAAPKKPKSKEMNSLRAASA
jgi:DNA (cytosine-5)-methyltransferase 1